MGGEKNALCKLVHNKFKKVAEPDREGVSKKGLARGLRIDGMIIAQPATGGPIRPDDF
jgi:hypothetical protein